MDIITPETASNESIKECYTKDTLRQLMHKSSKGDTASKTKTCSTQTAVKEMHCCFTWIATKPASRIIKPFHSSWVNSTSNFLLHLLACHRGNNV